MLANALIGVRECTEESCLGRLAGLSCQSMDREKPRGSVPLLELRPQLLGRLAIEIARPAERESGIEGIEDASVAEHGDG